MSLWDFLTNNTKKQEYPEITPIQVADNGAIDYQKSLELAMAQPKSFMENFKGRTVSIDVPTDITNNNEISLSKISKFQPGLLNDISAGAKENYTDAFSNSNWEKTRTSDGRQKGFGYRLGEGLGSIARFANTPWGRGLLMAGIVGATGGGALPAITFGADAGFGNKQNRTNDRLYRDALIQSGQNSLMMQPQFRTLKPEEQQLQLNSIADKINNYRGFVSDKAFNQLLTAKQLQDNAEYRNMLLSSQQRNQELANQIAKNEFVYKQQQDARKNAQEDRKLDILEQKSNNGRTLPAGTASNLASTEQGIQEMKTLMEQIPKFAKLGLAGPIGAVRRFNPYDADAQAFQQYVNTYKQVIGKGLEGGVLRKEDEAKYEKIIPKMGDTEEVLMRKARQLQEMLMQKYNLELTSLKKAGYNVGEFSEYTTTNEEWAF